MLARKHGGKREGAGRKKGVAKKKVNLSLTLEAVEKLDKCENKSATINKLIVDNLN